ncbi:hypothetical protein ACFSTI_17155 [Rhizorhabdus histidinilytica]
MSYQVHQAAQRLETIPPHVPADRVVELDYFSPPGVTEDPHLAWKRLHDGPDIVYTPYYGGHWIVTRADDMFAVMQDYETFSNWEFTVPKRGPGNPVLMPNQLDPPRHGPIRSVVLRPMSPKAVEPIEPVIRKIMADRIASIVPKGGCEFVSEFGGDIPPELFFEHARIPKDKLPEMKRFADAVARSDNEEDRRAARIGAPTT